MTLFHEQQLIHSTPACSRSRCHFDSLGGDKSTFCAQITVRRRLRHSSASLHGSPSEDHGGINSKWHDEYLYTHRQVVPNACGNQEPHFRCKTEPCALKFTDSEINIAIQPAHHDEKELFWRFRLQIQRGLRRADDGTCFGIFRKLLLIPIFSHTNRSIFF